MVQIRMAEIYVEKFCKMKFVTGHTLNGLTKLAEKI